MTGAASPPARGDGPLVIGTFEWHGAASPPARGMDPGPKLSPPQLKWRPRPRGWTQAVGGAGVPRPRGKWTPFLRDVIQAVERGRALGKSQWNF
jgi:hypothetical protein